MFSWSQTWEESNVAVPCGPSSLDIHTVIFMADYLQLFWWNCQLAVYCLHYILFSPEKNMQVLKDAPLLQSSDSFIWWCYNNLRYGFCLVKNQLLWKGFVAISPANLKIKENFVKKQGKKCMKQVWGNKLAVPVDMHMVEFSLKGFLWESIYYKQLQSMITQHCAVAQWVVCRVFALETGVQVLWQAFSPQQLF